MTDESGAGEPARRVSVDNQVSVGSLSGELADERRFVNTFPDLEQLAPEHARDLRARIHAQIDASIPPLIREIRSKIGPVAEASDTRFSSPDFTLYSGVGGQALALWKAYRYLREVEGGSALAESCLADCRRALTCALGVAKLDSGPVPSFYCGAAGVHALAAMIEAPSDPSAWAMHTHQVLGMREAALQQPETELLFGRAGYLHSLLLLRRHAPPTAHLPELDSALALVFDEVLHDGEALATEVARQFPRSFAAQSPLAYRFPAKSGHVYLGAAHGLAGVLYVLMHLPERCLEPRARGLVAGALDCLVSLQQDDGNFPVDVRGGKSDLVHFCHGAPGILPTLCKAYELFGDERYLAAARRAADCVWSRGILRKGLGVCHGIGGSVLSLLTLYRMTHGERDLYRALRMCEATWCERCLHTISESADPQRYRVGVPDFPYSLMEGNAGVLATYVALQRPGRSSFPGYEDLA